MRVLVTGGAGYIGSHALRALIARGHEAWAYDNLVFGHRAAVPPGRLIVGDLRDTDLLDHAIIANRIEAVMHFAAFAYVGESVIDPAKYYVNNVDRTIQLMERIRKHGIRRMVFSSTCAVYGVPDRVPITESAAKNPINPYGRTKWMIEQVMEDYARAYGWGIGILRYFNAAGAAGDGGLGEDHTPETHLIPLAISAALGRRSALDIFGTDYPTPDGTCIRDYTHVDDLATAHVSALERLEPETDLRVNLGVGRGYSVREVVAAVEAVSGRTVPVREGPRRAGDPPVLVADPSAAKELLGWVPRYQDLISMVRTAWAWHESHPLGYRS